MNYKLFGNIKVVPIFNPKKSVIFSRNYSTSFSGNWGFTVSVPLPSPVSMITIKFSFNVAYLINLNLNAYTSGLNPYVFKVVTQATTQVATDSKASVRLVVIEGGIFIKGTLAKVGTNPTPTLSYYFSRQKIIVPAGRYFWIHAF